MGEIGYLIVIILLIILLAILLVYLEKQKKSKKKLQDNILELQTTCREINEENQKLDNKYTKLKLKEEKNRKLAFWDSLTELPNREAFINKLESIVVTIRQEEKIGIMYIDLDDFKVINDTIGHSYGDELLIDVTDRLRQVVDENDFLSRFGGDEFIILTQNLGDIDLYEEKIKKIQKVFSYPFVLATREFFVTTSIGVAFAPHDGKTTQILIKNVDAAMYAAKKIGKNTYYFYEESISKELMDKIEIQADMRNAIEREEFQVYYQSQVDLKTNKISGFEALIRWEHPTMGLLMPMDFIPIAEETGLIVPIGKWVLKTACKQLKKWEEEFGNVNVAVNLSARQFIEKDLVAMVKDVIRETKILPNHLELEITETIALKDIDYSIKVMSELKKLGIQFSLDDFGTGYSSMSYLKTLPVDNLKIDKSFLDTIVEEVKDQKMVSAMVNLAQNLDLDVIAEGVEETKQDIFLKGIHCDKAQGYLYSRPVPVEEATVLLNKI